MQTVDQREHERQSHCALIDTLAPGDHAVKERENDKDDNERIDYDEERNRKGDDLCQTDIRGGKAEENREEEQAFIRNASLQQLVEEHRGTRGNAAAGRQACEADDNGKEQISCRTKEDVDRARENLTAVLRVSEHRGTRRTDVGERAVDHCHQRDRDETGDETGGTDGACVCDAAQPHGVRYERTDGDRGEQIHRLIAVLESLCERRVDIAARRCEHRAERRVKRLHKEDAEDDEERGGEHLAHAVDDLVRIQCQIVGRGEEDRRVDELADPEVLLREEGTNPNLERDGARTRHREQRPDDEIEDDEQCRRKQRPRLGTQERYVFAAREGNRRDAEERQSDARRHEAQHCKQRVIARRLTERGREDQIARAEVDGEHHEAERHEVFLFECVDDSSLQISDTQTTMKKQYPSLLQNKRTVSNVCDGLQKKFFKTGLLLTFSS